MNIVIVGAGNVGREICTHLASDGHNITVIDSDTSRLSELANVCDVFCYSGNGADVSTLKKAGADKADLLIAVASNDEINILCCTAAKKLGTRHTIARVINPDYSELMQLLKGEMGLSLTINPELAAAKEIYRALRFPAAAKIDTFCKGRVELAEFVVSENSHVCGATLNDLRNKLNVKFLVCGVLRDSDVYIPSGDFTLNAKDKICVTATDTEITKFFKYIGEFKNPIKNVIIFGGGMTTYYLEALLKNGKINSTVIEKDKELCRNIASDYSCTVVCDNGMKQEVLLEEGIESTDAFLALSDIDEENAIVSLYAKSKNVPKVITRIGTMPYINFFKNAGLDSIVSPKSSTAAQILHYVRAMANTHDSEIESLHRFMDGKIEALEFLIKNEIEGVTGIPLKEMKLKKGVLIASILHKNDITIPSGSDTIEIGDTVVIVSTNNDLETIGDILR